MSGFTSSALIITPDDEQAEREALIERCSAAGDELEVKETGATVQNGLGILRKALKRIPDSSKLSRLEVFERAPILVERERPGCFSTLGTLGTTFFANPILVMLMKMIDLGSLSGEKLKGGGSSCSY
jgi:hypothetical protein